jgi:hypothetical protein
VRAAVRHTEFEDRRNVDHENLSLSVSASAQLSRMWSVGVTVPVQRLRSFEDPPAVDTDESGVGDISLSVTFRPWDPEGADFVSERRLSFIAGLKLPTGNPDLDRFAGSTAEIVPLGSGTTDLHLGLGYAVPLLEELRAFDTFFVSVPLNENDDEPPPGGFLGQKPAFTIINRVGIAWNAAAWIEPFAAFDVQWKDRADGTVVSRDDGGTFLWFTPGVTIRPGGDAEVDLSLQLPIDGGHPSITLGISRRF